MADCNLRSRRTTRLGISLTVLALVACASGYSLDGSIGADLSLEFDLASSNKQADVLFVDYERGADSEELVLRLSLDTADLEIHDQLRVAGEDFQARVTLQRATHGGDRYPNVSTGYIDFDALRFKGGGNTRGEFQVLFINGRALTGKFDGRIADAAQGDRP